MSHSNEVSLLIELNNTVSEQYGMTFLAPGVIQETQFRLPESELSVLQTRFPRLNGSLADSLALLQYCWVPPYSLISPSEIIEVSTYLAGHYAELEKMFGKPVGWDDQVPDREGQNNFCRCDQSWNSNWIPVARYFDQEILFVDLDPGPDGKRGQLVQMFDDDLGLWVQGFSVGGWLKRITRAVMDDLFEGYLINPPELMRSYPLIQNGE